MSGGIKSTKMSRRQQDERSLEVGGEVWLKTHINLGIISPELTLKNVGLDEKRQEEDLDKERMSTVNYAMH